MGDNKKNTVFSSIPFCLGQYPITRNESFKGAYSYGFLSFAEIPIEEIGVFSDFEKEVCSQKKEGFKSGKTISGIKNKNTFLKLQYYCVQMVF